MKGAEAVARGRGTAEDSEAGVGGSADLRLQRRLSRERSVQAIARIVGSRCKDPDATIDTSRMCTLPLVAHDAIAESLGGADELCRLMEASRWAMSTYGQLVKAVRLRRPSRVVTRSRVEMAKLLAAAGKDGVVYSAPKKQRSRKAVIAAILKRRPRLEHLCIGDEDALYELANIPPRTQPRSITHLEVSSAVSTTLVPAAISACPSLTALTIHAHLHEVGRDGRVAACVAAVLRDGGGGRIRKLSLCGWHGQAGDLVDIIRVCTAIDDLSITLTQNPMKNWGNHDGSSGSSSHSPWAAPCTCLPSRSHTLAPFTSGLSKATTSPCVCCAMST